jgi:hypothetical protein
MADGSARDASVCVDCRGYFVFRTNEILQVSTHTKDLTPRLISQTWVRWTPHSVKKQSNK